MTAFDMTESIIAKSDQQNFEDYLGGPKLVTIAGVRKGSAEQPVDIELVEFPGKAYRPSKSMRRVLVYAWGADTSVYIGRRLELYGDPEVKFGGQKVGGIKIGKLSHIDKGFTINLTATKGKKEPHRVELLPDAPPPTAKPPNPAAIIDAFQRLGVTLAQLETRQGVKRDAWVAEDIAQLAALGKAIKAGETTTFEEFEPVEANEAGQQELTEAGE